jgi:protein involved in polysaccharide export with SLBB domain
MKVNCLSSYRRENGGFGLPYRFALAVLAAAFLGGCSSPAVVVSKTTVKRSDIHRSDVPAEADYTKTTTRTGGDRPDAPISRIPSMQTFARTPSTNSISITIQPDCLVNVKVNDDPTLDGNYPVNEIGAIELGYVGPVILINMSDKTAARKIKDALDGRYFRDATVQVRILRASYDKVEIGGSVNKPGLIRIGAGDSISLNDALLRAGGLKPSAKGAKIKIVRSGLLSAVAATLKGEEYQLMDDDGKASIPNVYLKNNDMAYVFSSDTEVPAEFGEKDILVLGEVNKPGIYRFSTIEPCTMMHLMFKMNGLPQYANKKAIKVVRQDKESGETEYKINIEKIMERGNPEDDFALENGDRVIVPARRLSIF